MNRRCDLKFCFFFSLGSHVVIAGLLELLPMYKDETRFEMKCFVWDGMLTAAFHKPNIGIHQRGQRRVDSGILPYRKLPVVYRMSPTLQ